MGRPKGSKNKANQIEESEIKDKIKEVRKTLTVKSPPSVETKVEEDKSPTRVKKADKEEISYNGIIPRIEHPRVPECLVDGGMLYRWLNDLRKTYLEEKVDKKEIKIINEIMDYIMRMEKKERDNKKDLNSS